MRTVCISLKELYEEKGAELFYGGHIEHRQEGDTEYYDLRKPVDNLYLACDGEKCRIIHEDNKMVILETVDTQMRIYLTREEYQITTFS